MPKEMIQLLLHKNYLDRPSNIMVNVNPKPQLETATSEMMSTFLFQLCLFFSFITMAKY